MAPELTETPSQPPSPESPGPDVRMSRLHEALKQLKARGSAPLSAVQAELTQAPAEAAEETAKASSPAPSSPVEAPIPGPTASPESVAPETPAKASSLAVEPAAPALPSAPSVKTERGAESRARPFRIEDWSPPLRLHRFRQFAEKVALQYPHGLPAAVGLAAADPWLDLGGVASRLALCLAERDEGEVLLVEPELATRNICEAAPAWGLADLAAGRASLSQAVAPTSAARLSLLGADAAASKQDPPLGEQWRSMMKQLRQRFRYIVSALPESSPVPEPWLASFDAVYLALAFRSTSQDAAAAALARLKACGVNVRGCLALG